MSPLEELLEAVREHERGNREKAASLLSEAVGSSTTLEPVKNSIDALVNPNPTLAEGMVRLLAAEERRRANGSSAS